MSDIILEVKNLTKKFGSKDSEFTAVNDISFSLQKGEVLGLLGPNGAGKTTTIQMLIGILTKTSGSIQYLGKDFYKNKTYCLQKINFTSSYNILQGRISSWENLLVFSGLYGVKNPKDKIHELAKYFEVENILHQRFFDLSAGQRTRMNLIKSLLNDPELILMDEPTASLDPDIADKTLSLIENLRESKKLSILYTSHNMDEITRICDKVIFLNHGKIIAQDTPLGLTKQITKTLLRIVFDDDKKIVETYLNKNVKKFDFNNMNSVTITLEEKDLPKIIFGLSKEGVWITDIEIQKPTLEDFFIQIARKNKYVA
ncbi:MAG: ABC transporter ATP-binding protein [bacterium]|nr:ABC transporter ATP-binding protein [bacterium]